MADSQLSPPSRFLPGSDSSSRTLSHSQAQRTFLSPSPVPSFASTSTPSTATGMTDSNLTLFPSSVVTLEKTEQPAAEIAAPANALVMDKGVRAWCTLVGGALTLFSSFGYTYAFGVYQDHYTRSNTMTATQASWIGSTQVFLIIALGLPAGKLLDMGYFRQVIFVGSLLNVICLFMLSIADTSKYYQVFLSQGVGMGIAGGLLYVPSIAIQSHYWNARRPMAIGLINVGNSMGGIVFPILLNQLFKTSVGFAWAVRSSAFLVLFFLTAANLLMSSRREIVAMNRLRPKPDLGGLFKDVPYMIFSFGSVACLWGLFFPYFYVQLFAILHNVDADIAFYSLTVMNAASIPGRIIPMMFVRKCGIFNLLIPCCVFCAVPILGLLWIKSAAGVLVFAGVYGFWSGAFIAIFTLAATSLAKDHNEAGIRLGLAYSIGSVGALTGTPITGELLGNTFPWFKPTAFSVAALVAGALLMAIARIWIVRRKGTQIV